MYGALYHLVGFTIQCNKDVLENDAYKDLIRVENFELIEKLFYVNERRFRIKEQLHLTAKY